MKTQRISKVISINPKAEHIFLYQAALKEKSGILNVCRKVHGTTQECNIVQQKKDPNNSKYIKCHVYFVLSLFSLSIVNLFSNRKHSIQHQAGNVSLFTHLLSLLINRGKRRVGSR